MMGRSAWCLAVSAVVVIATTTASATSTQVDVSTHTPQGKLLLQHAEDCSQTTKLKHAAHATPLVIYNRIPKCASSTMTYVLKKLAHLNNMSTHIETARGYFPAAPHNNNTADEENMWRKLYDLAANPDLAKKTIYTNHMFWNDFGGDYSNNSNKYYDSALSNYHLSNNKSRNIEINHRHHNPNHHRNRNHNNGFNTPIYIQIMREPTAREVSSYYYMMYGPRPEKLMMLSQNMKMQYANTDHQPSINEYMATYKRDMHGDGCANIYIGDVKTNLQTRFFCGFHPVCDDICSSAALLRAKQVLAEQYIVVGVLEELEVSLRLLERLLPQWFAGAVAEYQQVEALKNTVVAHFVERPVDTNATTNATRNTNANTTVNVDTYTSQHEQDEHVKRLFKIGYHDKRHIAPTSETLKLLRKANRQDYALYAFARSLLSAKARNCF